MCIVVTKSIVLSFIRVMSVKKEPQLSRCPITRTNHVIHGKWTLPIVFTLLDGTKRFKELERNVEGINTRMLVKELKHLEENGIINREVFAEVPPRVEYSLTLKGMALKGIIQEMKAWGREFTEW